MAPSAPRVRKRSRKRKRRNVSSSSSSSSPSSSGDEHPQVIPSPKAPLPAKPDGSDSDLNPSDSDATSFSSSRSSTPSTRPAESTEDTKLSSSKQAPRRHPSRSPSPPDTTLPPFIPANPITNAEKDQERILKEKFLKFWMGSIADGFKDDLEQIRHEPNMTTSRLSVLINALASGADVFPLVAQSGSRNQVNEVEVILGSSS